MAISKAAAGARSMMGKTAARKALAFKTAARTHSMVGKILATTSSVAC
jgi:hypothetical protein